MNKLVIINPEIKRAACQFIKGRNGEYRAIVKVQAGFLTVVDDDNKRHKNAVSMLRGFKKGALQSIQFKADNTSTWLTVFAKKGKKIAVIDEDILAQIEVGDINQLWFNSNLYNQNQYQAVNAKTWADKAFVMNNSQPNLK